MGIPFLSKRWEMVLLLFSGILVVYTLRVNMSVAVQDMRDDLNWSESEKGLVLSSFYWGYALGQIPGSRLAAVYGAKWIFGLSVVIPSFLTIFVPMAARSSLTACLIIRMMIGFFESASFPCVYHYIPVWVPLEEKTFMIPAILSGMYMGEIIGFSLSGILVGSDISINGEFYGGWPSVFYIFGLVGMLWFPIWAYFARESPEKCTDITREELRLIGKGKNLGSLRGFDQLDSLLDDAKPDLAADDTISVVVSHMHVADDVDADEEEGRSGAATVTRGGYLPMNNNVRASNEDALCVCGGRQISLISEEGDRTELAARTPWLTFFTHPASLTLLFNGWVAGWIGFTLLSEMPSYLTDVLGFNLESAGILSVFPFLALFVSSLTFGKLFTYLQKACHWEVRTVRQVAQYVSLGGSSVALIVCAYLEDKYAAYFFMILSLFLFGATVASLACAYSDCSPNYSPIMNTIGNTIGAIAGIIGPIVVAAFTDAHPGVRGWREAFFLTAAMTVAALVTWYFFQTSEIVAALNNPKRVE